MIDESNESYLRLKYILSFIFPDIFLFVFSQVTFKVLFFGFIKYFYTYSI